MRALVVRIWLKLDDSLSIQLVDDPLYALPVYTHRPRMPGNGFRSIRIGNGTKDLPSGTCQTEFCYEAITGKLQSTVQPKHIQYQLCHDFSCVGPLIVGHIDSSFYLTTYCQFDYCSQI